MGNTVKIEIEDSLATLRLERAHGNAINPELADDLWAACRQLADDPDVRGVMLAGAGKLFCPGLDIQELIELERPEMERFLDSFSGSVHALYSMPKPVVARIHGHAVAGGCVLSLTADWRVLRGGALVGLNEVRVGVAFPFGVAMILRESVPSTKVEEVALFGRNYSGEDAVVAGLVHEVCSDDEFEERCRSRLEELADKDAQAFAISKRYLRMPVVERIHAHDAAARGEFLDSWFSSSTQERLRSVAEELRRRSGGQ